MGLDKADDAGVYKLTEDIAIIQSVDFFTPVVDDPFLFGQIAAANALSDIYAMGGVPKTAMNIVTFPVEKMDISILRRVLQGGLVKMKEAGVVLAGGHSIEDKELKYGLSVTGLIHPKKILTKAGLKPGSVLVLTKPIGTGIVTTAIKAGLVLPETEQAIAGQMAELNMVPAKIMEDYPVCACTDITGFGLLGHMAEMISGSGCCIELWADKVPLVDQTREFASMGLIPAGAHKNREFRKSMVDFSGKNFSEINYSEPINKIMQLIMFDPQTSGGLLICVDENHGEKLVEHLHREKIAEAALIGRVMQSCDEKIFVKSSAPA